MGFEQKTGFVGLFTNVGEISAPASALKRAENVVIRRAGVIEPRPGTIAHTTLSLTGTSIQRLIPYPVATLACYDASGTDKWWSVTGNAAVQYTNPLTASAGDPARFRSDLIPSASARGNLYVGCADGTLKWSGSGAFSTAGLSPLFQLVVLGTAGAGILPNGSQYAYRVVAKKTDANGVVVRSRPTGAVTVANSSGAAQIVTVYLAASIAGLCDSYEVYRTRVFSTSTVIDEEYQLVKEIPFSTGTISFVDSLADASRGATGYWCPSREGIQGANDRPPACGAMALFRGSVFFGNVSNPKRLTSSYTYAGSSATGSATGIGIRTITGNITSGSNQITSASSTTGLQKGQVIGSDFPAGSYITNISGTTITMSGNATGTAAGTNLAFTDAVQINGTWTAITELQQSPTPYTSSVFWYYSTPPVPPNGRTLVLETFLRTNGAALTVRATHGDEYFPALPLYDATALEGSQDVWPHGLMWSKTDEPEHAPLINYAFVGDKNSAILALAATRDALYILKEDGIWRLTGYNGQWRIDPFDLTTRCILPSSVCTLNGKVFALTNRGFVTIGEDGVQVISMPIADQLKGMIYTLTRQAGPYRVTRAAATYLGYAATANERDFEYVFLVGNMLSSASSGITGALVYNDTTKAWTSWNWTSDSTAFSCSPNTLAYAPKESTVLIGQYGSTDVTKTKALASPTQATTSTNGDRAYAADGEATVTVTSSNPLATFYTPATQLATGDVIVDGAGDGTLYAITAVGSTTSVSFGAACATGSARVYRPIQCVVEPRGFNDPDLTDKKWAAIYASFSRLVGPYSVTCETASSVTLQGALTSETFDAATAEGATAYERGARLRALAGDHAARGWSMNCAVRWKLVYGTAALESIAAEYRETRANRQNLAVGVT